MGPHSNTSWQDPWDNNDYDDDDAPRRTGPRWTTIVAWIAIAAMVLVPMMSLFNLYQAVPLLVILSAAILGGIFYLVSTRGGELITRINDKLGKK
ncbi:hypothetical protein HT102_00840 [Hoyosella sp. G463]|uniref:Uncharacterized protein n=1 Tax=Lolliginicoccus lacisalsi TaxID=2742202 RepID=A0A927J9Y5_9ACTN|nr:hypothetical protein [Lolliginicoccus lacisalsi]MBD8505035.1 hypothetical protein [Lolliginicoccus lacisalsi]